MCILLKVLDAKSAVAGALPILVSLGVQAIGYLLLERFGPRPEPDRIVGVEPEQELAFPFGHDPLGPISWRCCHGSARVCSTDSPGRRPPCRTRSRARAE